MKNMIKLSTILITFIILSACAPQKGDKGETVVGPAGKDASSCTVNSTASGAVITCPDGSVSTVQNGTDGQTPQIIEFVKLCPMVAGTYGAYPQYAIRVGSTVYGTYSAGGTSWLAVIYPGTYQTTTNGINCVYTVSADGTITN